MSKGLLAGAIGLFLATVGVDHVTGDMRFTFGSFEMTAGISLIPAIVGLFALSEVFIRASESTQVKAVIAHKVGFRLPPFPEWRPRLWLLLKSCAIGSFIGALPGTGAATSSFIAYSEAKRSAPNRDRLGTGEPDGIVASESANNAVTGSAMLPTLALGIPGDPVAAVMLGSFIVHGLAPRRRLPFMHQDWFGQSSASARQDRAQRDRAPRLSPTLSSAPSCRPALVRAGRLVQDR